MGDRRASTDAVADRAESRRREADRRDSERMPDPPARARGRAGRLVRAVRRATSGSAACASMGSTRRRGAASRCGSSSPATRRGDRGGRARCCGSSREGARFGTHVKFVDMPLDAELAIARFLQDE